MVAFIFISWCTIKQSGDVSASLVICVTSECCASACGNIHTKGCYKLVRDQGFFKELILL